MSYKVTDTVVVDQNKNINNIGITTSAILDASKDPGTGIGTDYTHSIFGNGWRLSAPASTTYYKLATLPVGSGGNTFDHLVINGVLGSWTSTNQTPFEIYFSNRNSFNTKYISYGNVRSDVRILGISTNSTVEIWAQHQASQFTKLTYSIANSLQVIPVPSPTSTTTAPTGTTVFDSSTATPRFIINDSDNVGIGTISPTYKLESISSSNQLHAGPDANTGLFVNTTDTTFSRSFKIDNSVGAITAYVFNNSQKLGLSVTSTGDPSLYQTDSTKTFNLSSAGLLTLSSNSVERVRLDLSGNLLVGSATSTGTASQPLQVTGGAYVSGNLGVGTIAPSFRADIAGDARLTSTNKMRFGGTAGTTNFYIQYNSTTNSLDFVAG